MDESSSPEPSKKEDTAKSVDLSELQSFSFGTQWVEAPKQSRGGSFKPRSGGSRPPRGDRPDRRQGGSPPRKDRRPPRGAGEEGERDFSSDRRGGQQQRFGGRDHGHGRQQFVPYDSAVFDVCFYPDDNCFSAIIKAMRTNHLTYELFQVAKLFMEKPDRFIASITRKAAKDEKPEKVFISAIDNMPFATEEEAILHAVKNHTDAFFTIEEIEVEPPSGNFTFVNRCPFTKELLGPPNYHKYEETLRNHHRTRLPNMSFDKLKSSIETVREEEEVQKWLVMQTKANRYSTKPEGEEQALAFSSIDDAIGYLRTTAKSKVVKQVNYARVSGAMLEKFSESEAFKAMDGERQRQQRFPLDTANAIRGRMRREKFSIYKKGSKGVTYVCSTKRNFRTPGQVMSPDLDRIIRFLEANQMIKAKELGAAYVEWFKTDAPDETFDEKKLMRDLHWLVADGYVSHFEDDSLFAQPVLETGSSVPKPKGKVAVEKPKKQESDPVKESPTAEESPETEKVAETDPVAAEAKATSGEGEAQSEVSEAAKEPVVEETQKEEVDVEESEKAVAVDETSTSEEAVDEDVPVEKSAADNSTSVEEEVAAVVADSSTEADESEDSKKSDA